MPSDHYNKNFYELMRAGSVRSAEAILPLVLQILQVHSVVDVGCGDGNWLAVFQRLGVEEILGIDGDYVNPDLLQIPADHFQAADLSKPLRLGRVYDLAISMEVAEHLERDCAPMFVESLVRLAPVVLFSAAIPLQGGNQHLNEQWPDKWAALFREHGYLPVDFIRKHVWQNEAVEWWYAQNTLLFVQLGVLENNEAIKKEFEQTDPRLLCLVHPRNYLDVVMPVRPIGLGVVGAARMFVTALKIAVKKRVYSMRKT